MERARKKELNNDVCNTRIYFKYCLLSIISDVLYSKSGVRECVWHIAHDFMLPDLNEGKKCNVIPAITRGGRSCTRACNQLSDVTRAHRSCTYHCMARTHLVCPTMQIISSVYSRTCFPVRIIAIGNIESSNLCGQVRCWKTAPKPS